MGRFRVASLDGLRGLALLAVLAYHVAPGYVPGGFLGVETFFVLSGYLLGGLLLEERVRTGAIDAWAYAGRRLRRIGPALAVLVVALLVLGPLLAPEDAYRLPGDIVAALTGLTNWHLIAENSSYFSSAGRPSLLRHVWSVAVELQFYLLCPFLVAWLARRARRAAVAGLAGGIALSATVMALLYHPGDPSRAYYGTDVRAGALLAGVLLAVLLHTGRQRHHVEAPPLSVVIIGTLALGTLVALYLNGDDQARATYPVAFLATQVATALVIAAARTPGPVAQLLRYRRLRWLGRRAYGIYLWHWPLVVLLRPGIDVSWSPAVTGSLTVVGAVVLGSLSYRFVERPLLGPGVRRPAAEVEVAEVAVLPGARRGLRQLRPVLAGVGAVGLVGLYIHLPRTDPLAETLRDGEQVLAAQRPPAPLATAAPAPATTLVPVSVLPPETAPAPTAAAPPPAPTTTLPPAPLAPEAMPPITAIGDSVMVSAAAALAGRLGPSSYINAVTNRQFSEAAGIVRQFRDAGSLGAVVVVHLGNNGMVSDEEIDALAQEVPVSATLVLVNVRVDRPWQAGVNAALAAAAARHPGVRIADWYAVSEGHREWFQRDGTHLRTTSGSGATAFAEAIAAAVPPPPPPPPAPPAPPPARPAREAVRIQ